MDKSENLSDVECSAEQRELPLSVGNWRIEWNLPHGFVVSNSEQNESYHFYSKSNGWVTGVNRVKKEPVVRAFNSEGAEIGNPVLVDKKSFEKTARFLELCEKYNKDQKLSNEEFEEMCLLMGVIKKG